MSNVLKFEPTSVGEDFRFDADAILDEAKGKNFETIAILGQDLDGQLWLFGNANTGQMMVLMEMAKHKIIFGDD